jgi:hypothetical protein
MRLRHRLKRNGSRLAIPLLLVPIAVTSTPPAIDWYIFQVDGQVTRPAGTLKNHAVALFGKCFAEYWKQILTCDGEGAEEYGPFVTATLTADDGSFSLRVSTCGSGYPNCDTLAVGVVYPDTVVMGTPFLFNSVKPTEIEKTGKSESGYGCGCDDEYTYVDGHIYNYPVKTVPVP